MSSLHGLRAKQGGCRTHWGLSSWTPERVLSPKKEFQKAPKNLKVHSKVVLFSERKIPNSATIFKQEFVATLEQGGWGGRGEGIGKVEKDEEKGNVNWGGALQALVCWRLGSSTLLWPEGTTRWQHF